ncbi:hypothetical protein B0A49_05362 [Cryomyces minteri]|uniref:Protein kinase domain-containing protein n=1 Tax=Cryomyces minteri TaxID=331657 RepID=A0A4U0URS9_9PEZI|nr:hypothetical protein B0A49_13410 [Cryomyces minteri]TKA44252.1 hypothetical protein B0A49_13387 [Cryomyces minteri]TKA75989.1 hypothetical protein B0A49_05362 [Cryomyces minteri]
MTAIRTGLRVQGAKSVYLIAEQLHRAIWVATDEHRQRRIIKTAPPSRLKNERNILRHFEGEEAIRHFVDETTNPPSLVLEYFDSDMLHESLIWGKGWHIFKPEASEISTHDETYPLHVLRRHDRFVGPFPVSYAEIADDESLTILEWVTRACDKRTAFALASEKEISKEDRTFICKVMKLGPRDRPSAKELLQDEWFAAFRR